ncbi:MAG: hypothetical protein ACR2M3_01410, partial [Thermomicrobiales bacterium]
WRERAGKVGGSVFGPPFWVAQSNPAPTRETLATCVHATAFTARCTQSLTSCGGTTVYRPSGSGAGALPLPPPPREGALGAGVGAPLPAALAPPGRLAGAGPTVIPIGVGPLIVTVIVCVTFPPVTASTIASFLTG